MTHATSWALVLNMIAAGVRESVIPVKSWKRLLRSEEVDGLAVRRLALLGHHARLTRAPDGASLKQLERSLKLRDERLRVGPDLVLDAPDLTIHGRNAGTWGSLC